MLRAGMQKSEIEQELSGKGDFVQIDCLTQFMREPMTMDMKKFVLLKLASLYEKTGMLVEAAKKYDGAALVSIPFSDKIKYYMKEAELYITSGNFEKSEEAMKKAMGQANTLEKQEIYYAIKGFYKKQAENYERELKRAHAARIYEKLMEMKLDDLEKKEMKERLLVLYDKLGKMREHDILERREF